jgi:hypothetical protein
MLTTGMESSVSSDFMDLDITSWACYFMVRSSRLPWPLLALTVERCVRFLVCPQV